LASRKILFRATLARESGGIRCDAPHCSAGAMARNSTDVALEEMMSGQLSRSEYDECFAKLFGPRSLLRRAPIKTPSKWRALRRLFARTTRPTAAPAAANRDGGGIAGLPAYQ
jgi:hypothetical protein